MKQFRHFLRRFQMPLGIAGEQPSGGFQSPVMAQAGEDVEYLARIARGMTHTVGGEKGKLEFPGQIDGSMIDGFFVAIEMALQFDVDIAVAENVHESLECLPCFGEPAAAEGRGERAVFAAGQEDEAIGEFFEFAFFDRTAGRRLSSRAASFAW